MSGIESIEVPSPIAVRVEVLRDAFPDAFIDGKFNLSALAAYFEQEQDGAQPEGEVGLHWPGQANAIRSLRRAPNSSLEPTSPFLGPHGHVFIEGDNLEVMKLLQRAYFGGVKMAFVDPPYNNGIDDIYIDDFESPWPRYKDHREAVLQGKRSPAVVSSATRGAHGRWLTMMLPRLFLIRNLLASDGVVFVAIDDHEVHRLRFVLDQVFGPENFVCTLIWEKRYSPAPDAKDVGYVHENILAYRRSADFEAAFLPMSEAQISRYQNPDGDQRGPWKAADYTCRFTAEERQNLYYPIVNPTTGEDVWPKRSRVWACTQEEHARRQEEGRVWWGLDGSNSVPAKKAYLSEIRQGQVPSTLLKNTEVGHTDDATKEVRRYFPEIGLTPKPIELIRHLMTIADVGAGDVVLDPFARAGSTAEAVIVDNADTGNDARVLLIGPAEPVSGASPAQMLPDVARIRAERALDANNGSDIPSMGLRTFSQRGPVFLSDEPIDSTEGVGSESDLDKALSYIASDAPAETIALNVALSRGWPLDSQAQTVELTDGVQVFVFGSSLAICVEGPLGSIPAEELLELGVESVVCLERAFGSDDELLFNTRLAMTARGLYFETI